MAECIDLTSQKFGYYTVLKKGSGRKTNGGKYKTTWICQCDCGNIREVDGEKLKKRPTISCGCKRSLTVSQKNREDCIGNKYGRLTVIRYLEPHERKTKQYNYLCQCECGNYVQSNLSKLKTGHAKSCGCIVKEKIGSLNKKYHYSNRRMYGLFAAMRNRCGNENNVRYNSYGAKGITVCDEWNNDVDGFDNFYEWAMANGYSDDLTIDRIDNNKGYSPDNCRWITNKEQQNNKKNNILATYNGETHTISEWATILGKKYYQVYNALVYQGKNIEEIINNKNTAE